MLSSTLESRIRSGEVGHQEKRNERNHEKQRGIKRNKGGIEWLGV